MDKMQQLLAAIELQKKFAELYYMDVLIDVRDDYIHIRYRAFCELFPDGPDRSESAGKYIRHRKKFNGVDIIALEEVRECEN